MELYLDLQSQPCRAVYMFAKKLKLKFDFKFVDMENGAHYGPDFMKVNPLCKVPVMKDGDFTLTESIAILVYMAQKASAPDHWYPADMKQRARVNEYLNWQHTNLRAHGTKILYFRIMYPIIMGCEAPKDKSDEADAELNKSLQIVEDKFLAGKLFITGNQVSLADLVALVEIMQPFCSGFDVFKSRPKLAAWKDRVRKEIGENLFNEAHEQIMKVQSMGERMKGSAWLAQITPLFKKLHT